MKHSIAVIGAVNIDICGTPDGELLMEDSNPGRINYSIGGVGFNIARNLSLLGCDVSFIAALGEDSYLPDILKEADKYSIDFSSCLFCQEEKNSCYLFITDKNGDMVTAVNDMRINSKLTEEFLSGKTDFFNSFDAVLIDTNLTEETLSFLCKNIKVPLFADSVSASKVVKIKNSLKYLSAFKPNRIEAEILTGIKITDIESAEKAIKSLLDTGIERVYMTLGKDGVISADKNNICCLEPLCSDSEIVNTSGAGDAFFACAVKSCLDKKNLYDSTVISLKGARAACLTKKSINENILNFIQEKETTI